MRWLNANLNSICIRYFTKLIRKHALFCLDSEYKKYYSIVLKKSWESNKLKINNPDSSDCI